MRDWDVKLAWFCVVAFPVAAALGILLGGCEVSYSHRIDAEWDDYHTHVLLEGEAQQAASIDHARFAELQQAVEMAWSDVHGPIDGCLADVHVLVPESDDSFGSWCDFSHPTRACAFGEHTHMGGQQLVVLRRDIYESSHEDEAQRTYVHELIHLAHHCAYGEVDADHNGPMVWYHVTRAAYEYAGMGL